MAQIRGILRIDFTGDPLLLRATDGAVTVSIPIRIRRYGGRKQVVVPQSISTGLNASAAPTAMQVALARGHRWLRLIESGKVINITAIAKTENVDRSYISRVVNLTTLAPEIQAAILDETLPGTVSLLDLARAAGRVEAEVLDGHFQYQRLVNRGALAGIRHGNPCDRNAAIAEVARRAKQPFIRSPPATIYVAVDAHVKAGETHRNGPG